MKFILREWRKGDVDEMVNAANNLNIAMNLRYIFPHPYLLDDAKGYVNDCISNEGKKQITHAICMYTLVREELEL